ncbi:MAG TPA: hypothetical protein VN780_04760 [Candidatus Eisenbacteria bacterium]|jgi:hypothetical protein|nr:hypothetical protein [Candidatus Eisenbacteria bacterium]
MRILCAIFLAVLFSATSFARPQQQIPPPDLASRVPAPKTADVDSVDHIMFAIYDVISGPPGERDWNRFRSLFVPEGRLTSTVKREGSDSIRLLTVEEYVNGAGKYFLTNGFFESAIVNKVQRFGNIAQVFSSYESRHAASDKPFTRGINSMQLLFDGKRWWVLSILWDEESASNPLPKEMAQRSSAPVTQQ